MTEYEIDKHLSSWRDRIDFLLEEGFTREEIAQQAGVHPTAFRKLIRDDLNDIITDKKDIRRNTYKKINDAIEHFEKIHDENCCNDDIIS